jgi:anti-anti-sigma factor
VPARLALQDDMTIYQAADLKSRLLGALAGADHLALDLSGVAEIDTAGLQLLMLVMREAGRQGKTLEISGHSPAVQQTLDFCNLVGVFGDPMLISARA